MKSGNLVNRSCSALGFGSALNRRQAIKLLTGAAAAVALGGAVGVRSVSAAGSHVQTTFALNLRAQASFDSEVLDVIPAWELPLDRGDSTDDFIAVEWNGQAGWANRAYLIPAYPGATRLLAADAKTTDLVNFRQGPSLNADIWQELPKGARVVISEDVYAGFTYAQFDGLEGWIWSDYLGSSGPSAGPGLSTTSNLNLRAEPSLSAEILLVMPMGAFVIPGTASTNGFRSVTYGNHDGWASEDYLA